MFSDALRHSHTRTAWPLASVTPSGAESIKHVEFSPFDTAEDQSTRIPLLREFTPPFQGSGGVVCDPFFTEYFIGDAMLSEVQHVCGRSALLSLERRVGLGSPRLFGYRCAGDPPILEERKVSSWFARLEVLGLIIDFGEIRFRSSGPPPGAMPRSRKFGCY